MRFRTTTVPGHEQTVIEDMPEGHALHLQAALPDGRHLVVTRSQKARGYKEEDHLVFLGPAEGLARHDVRYLSTFSDGGSVEFDFAGGRVRFKASAIGGGKPSYRSWFRPAGGEAVDVAVVYSADDRIYVG